MRRLIALLAAVTLIAAIPALVSSLAPRAASAQPPQGEPQPPGGPRPPGGPGMPGARMMFPPDSFSADRDSAAKVVLEHIAGKENMPAESVFKNIKILKGLPAGRLVQTMNNGFGRALGVNCNYCHVSGHWADEDKPQKETARGMMLMVAAIDDSLIPKVKFPKPDERHRVGCFTCHHGRPKF